MINRLLVHAGFAPEGQDIVCSAVSTLTMVAINGLEEHLQCEIAYEIKDGYLQVELKQTPDDLTQAILATMPVCPKVRFNLLTQLIVLR